MRDHEISFDTSKTPATPVFAPVFNAAVHFIDRAALVSVRPYVEARTYSSEYHLSVTER